MAAPVVAGAALLLRQALCVYLDLCLPSGPLLKALLLHSARRVRQYSTHAYDTMYKYFRTPLILNDPPDTVQGFGALSLQPLLSFLKEKGQSAKNNSTVSPLLLFDRLEVTEFQTMEIQVSLTVSGVVQKERTVTGEWVFFVESAQSVRITLVWYDPPHSAGFMDRLLLHDLDLELLVGDEKSDRFSLHLLGNDFEENHAESGRKSDDRNNVEQIVWRRPRCPITLFDLSLFPSALEVVNVSFLLRARVLSHALPVAEKQRFALVIEGERLVERNISTHTRCTNSSSEYVREKHSSSSELTMEKAIVPKVVVPSDDYVFSPVPCDDNTHDASGSVLCIVFNNVSLGAYYGRGMFVQDRVLLRNVSALGTLQRLTIELVSHNDGDLITGHDATLFTVIVTDPVGRIAQVFLNLSTMC